jgi:dolichol-phosphate mannosyltransferase
MAKTSNPLFYFGSVGIASTIVGVALGAYVAYDWVFANTSHEVLAVVGSFAILFGVQLLMFGVLSDMMVTVNREQTRRLEDLARRLSDDGSPGYSSVDSEGGEQRPPEGRNESVTDDVTPEDAGVVEAADSAEQD